MRLFGEKKNRAQGLVEYALIIALIAIVCIAVVGATGQEIEGLLTSTQNALGDVVTKGKSE